MSDQTIRRAGFAAAFRHQFVLLWRLRRVAFLYILLVAAALPELVAWRLNTKADYNIRPGSVFVSTLTALILMGALWALVVWRDEGPSKRQYHWSLPVDVTAHDLARVAAGAAWLVLGMLINCAVGWVLVLLQGNAGELRVWGGMLPLVWIVAPLTLYLMISVFAVALNRPVEWLFGMYLATALLLLLFDITNVKAFDHALDAVFGAKPWGLGFVWYTGPEALLRHVPATTFGVWAGSALLWLAIPAALTAGAALLRRGRA